MRSAKSRSRRFKKASGLKKNEPKIRVPLIFDTYAGRWVEDDPYETKFSSRHGGRVLTDTLRDHP